MNCQFKMASSSGGSELPVTMQPPAAQAAPAASAQRHYFRHTPTNYNVHDWTCGQRPFGCERPQSAHAYSFEFEGEQICGRCFAQWSDDNWSRLKKLRSPIFLIPHRSSPGSCR